ncbi:maleylpyruvate isomerase family mycothiol-dependent enzyme [Nocardia sp. CDC159]|uniref:Maleylpyruvate isomerase family mycothiol-dependent enzyme n=1 Tax=Nocardia pulmonis TaxID=2951408 RepID=A0A9X2E3J2_9NOCA|nr:MULTISPECIES: maleylpyruvate isomerase family mycothiol-dependent enzyme [Nocardia]MCM6773239.1 maleylpyruvate isomerase family mycothiol-dependent enzyme [Nocardia pulmonis]MCM6786126.1 maleylpyruvate isomerase family mycothiol-dependent enzyme [Nocardia sp. CDC159]
MSTRDLLRAERAELIALLRALSDEEWLTPSLCAGWRVRDVVGHLLYDAIPAPTYAGVFLRCGLSADRTNNVLVDRSRALPTARLVSKLEHSGEHITRLVPRVGLADMLVHQQDIRRPLGRFREIPADRLRAVLSHPDPFARPGRYTRGLRFVATDIDWTSGSGPEVRGPGEALALAMVGRRAALADLDGAGVATLRRRMGAPT